MGIEKWETKASPALPVLEDIDTSKNQVLEQR